MFAEVTSKRRFFFKQGRVLAKKMGRKWSECRELEQRKRCECTEEQDRTGLVMEQSVYYGESPYGK